jgi:hypothetical protein
MLMAQHVYKEAHTPAAKGRRLSHMVVHRKDDGGHKVVHHYHEDGIVHHTPQEFEFGREEGHHMMRHIAKHMHVEHHGELMDEDGDE